MTQHLLDSLTDGLSKEEQQACESLTDKDLEAINLALAIRCGFKAQSLHLGLFLSDDTIDTLTAALISG